MPEGNGDDREYNLGYDDLFSSDRVNRIHRLATNEGTNQAGDIMDIAEAAVVGAGPIGLEMGAALKRAGVDYIHLEAKQIGNTISWYPHQVRFFSSPERIAICGVPLHTVDQAKASREEYLAYLRGIVEQFDLEVRTYERVTKITKGDNDFTLVTEKQGGGKQEYQVRNVILAIGDMAWPRMLHIPGEDSNHVDHYFDEPHKYFRQEILIVGGKNSAVEAAIRCYRLGAKVSLSYRGEKFNPESIKYWLLPEIEMLVKTGKIKFYPNTEPVEIRRQDVSLLDVKRKEIITVGADFVLLMTGYVADMKLFETAGAELEPESRAPVVNMETMESTVPGLFVAGTVAAGTQRHYRLFIENCHAHVAKIVKKLTGKTIDGHAINPLALEEMPES